MSCLTIEGNLLAVGSVDGVVRLLDVTTFQHEKLLATANHLCMYSPFLFCCLCFLYFFMFFFSICAFSLVFCIFSAFFSLVLCFVQFSFSCFFFFSFLFFRLSSFSLLSLLSSDIFHIFLVVGQSPSISAVEFADSSRKVFSSASDTTVKLWDVGDNGMQLLHTFHQGASMPVTVLSTSKDGSFFVCGGLRDPPLLPPPFPLHPELPQTQPVNSTSQINERHTIALTTLHPVYCIATSPPHYNQIPYHNITSPSHTTRQHNTTTHNTALVASCNIRFS